MVPSALVTFTYEIAVSQVEVFDFLQRRQSRFGLYEEGLGVASVNGSLACQSRTSWPCI